MNVDEEKARSIQAMFDGMTDSVAVLDPFTLHWSMKGVGFGEYRFYMHEDGQLHIANECMNKDSIKRVLGIMVDQAVLDDPVAR